jgi:uncharacterized glyoxalase superfamily protein PhnB
LWWTPRRGRSARASGGNTGFSRCELATHDATAPVVPNFSIQVDDVDAAYTTAAEAGAEIVHPLTDEPWGVRRFFVRDRDGRILNVLSHQ